MKKASLFKIPILTVAAGLLGMQNIPVSAMVTTEDGHQAWSIAEMKELYYEFEAEKTATCGKDPHCRRELSFFRAETESQYAALQGYSMSSFVLSAINPSTSAVRLYFRDIDAMAMEMGGKEQRSPLTEAYVAWLDSSYPEPDYSFVDAMREDRHPVGMHTIYRANSTSNGPNWFPVETEVEISTPNAHLELNDNHMIMLYGLNEPSSVLSWVNYESCLNTSSYQPGMECRLMYDDTGNRLYVPFEVEVAAPTEEVDGGGQDTDMSTVPTTEPTTDSGSPESNIPEPSSSTELSTSELDPIAASSEDNRTSVDKGVPIVTRIVTTSYQGTASPEVSYVATPAISSGSNTDVREENPSEQPESPNHVVEVPLAADSESQSSASFPWWLLVIAMVIAGTLGIFWWFILPLFRRSNDKEG